MEKTRKIFLAIKDSYDFGALNEKVCDYDKNDGFKIENDVFYALKEGVYTVYLNDGKVLVNVEKNALLLGEKFPLDKGFFKGKKVVVFGDSITDGHLLDERKPDGKNYEETYFAKLCYYLEAASDPTDLEKVNFSRGGTTITFGKRYNHGISGVERIDSKVPFTDMNGTTKLPRKEVETADLCVVFYGTNDMGLNVYPDSSYDASKTDRPKEAKDALTIKGAAFFMFDTIRKLNPDIKILVLPPFYRGVWNLVRLDENNKHEPVDMTTDIPLRVFGKAIEEAGKEFGVKFFNWFDVFNYENFGVKNAAYSKDGLHPNVAGHEKMFRFILNAEKELQEKLQK